MQPSRTRNLAAVLVGLFWIVLTWGNTLALSSQAIDDGYFARLPLNAPQIQLFLRISDFRVEQGKHFVFNNSRLMKVAQEHAEDMTKQNYLSPKTKEGQEIDVALKEASYMAAIWTINVAQGILKVDEVFETLINDNKGRGNLLEDEVREIGIGYVAKQGKWVVIMGRRLSECGNGFVDFKEQCDDGNKEDGDCCSKECKVETDCTCSQPEEMKPVSKCHPVLVVDGSKKMH
jgi:cysteine-rich repeat protein